MDRAAHRNFLGRKLGIMKKANMLHRKHDARITVWVEKDNIVYCYQSDPNWPAVENISVESYNVFTPDHFDTVADRSVPGSGGGVTTRPGSPYSFDSFSSASELQAVHEVPETDLTHETAGATCTEEPGVDNAYPSDVLAAREYSPSFLPLLDMELQSSIAHQVLPEQQQSSQIAQGVTSLLSLWNSSSASSSACLDTAGPLGPSSGPLPPASKKARHATPDADRIPTKSQPGPKRTPMRKSNRTPHQAKKYF
ncbi:hypothetical protein F4679DRAFT_544179 [Xylaria curta]|nr:hypothetical protein F4679DRAFT_544179 [Xylaria curta]